MVTIKEVAERAGVSSATVSYVLNNSRQVRPGTRDRVLDAASALGYTINQQARMVAAGRSRLVGLMISDITNPFFPEIIKSFEEQASLRDLNTLIMATKYDAQRTRACMDWLRGLRAEGLAVLTSEIPVHLIESLLASEISVVHIDPGHVGPHMSRIVLDYDTGISQAVQLLKEMGHAQIGFISGPPHLVSIRARLEAFYKYAGDRMPVVYGDLSVQSGHFATSKLLASNPVTAIIAANDLMAIGAMHCIYDRGLSIPRDISLVGFDNIRFSEYTHPPLTTVDQPTHEIGCRAFEAIWKMREDEHHQGAEYVIGTHLVVRQSVDGPPPLRELA